MQRLAAAEADGMVVNFLSATDITQVRDNIASVPRMSDSPVEVTARVFVMASDSVPAREAARRHITGYLTVPAYAEFQRWLGRGAALRPVWEAWDQGDRRGALASVPDDVVDDLIIAGPVERCAEAILAYATNGADAINVVILPDGGETDPAAKVSFLCDLARELRATS
jgi:alkanesulfonate monooxygenase SsuD/methylene tetrahydromethanopterin reductase-like flavin-dependent oxidoreductase (luciferase family)